MTRQELAQALPTYAAGLEAELTLLRQLVHYAEGQREASQGRNLTEVNRMGDARARVLAGLVQIEHEIKPIRLAITAQQEEASTLDGFQDVVSLHHAAADLVASIMATDQQTMKQLRDAELARRLSAQTLEAGEHTLAAYRRVLQPDLPSAAILDKKG